MKIGYILVQAVVILVNVYTYVMLATCLLSWFVPPYNRVMQFLNTLCEPVVAPFRTLSQKLTGSMGLPIDLSFLLAYFALQILSSICTRLMVML